MVNRHFHGLLLAGILGLAAIQAKAIEVEPGQWDMTYSVTMPMLAEPRETSVSDCIVDAELTPEDFTEDEQNPCEFSEVISEKDRISWQMNCPSPGGSATGTWSIQSDGDSLTGEGDMTMSMGGQTMTMTMTMAGQRTGACEN